MTKTIRIFAALVMAFMVLGCSSFKQGTYDFMMSAERSRVGLKHSSVSIDGQTLSYLERPGDGEVIVLVHGFGANKDNWTRFIKYIPRDYRVLAFDMPGHGDNEKLPDRTYTIDYMASSLDQAMNKLGISRFHLAGNSMGGWISIFYAARNPGKVMTLCLLDNAGLQNVSPEPSDLALAILKGKSPLTPTTQEEYDELMEYAFHNKPFIPWPITSVLADNAIENSEFNKKMWKEFTTQSTDIYPMLADLNLPVLVIWGDRDRILHVSTTELLRKSLRDKEIIIMKDCGHLPMLERPHETAGYYVAFLGRHKGS